MWGSPEGVALPGPKLFSMSLSLNYKTTEKIFKLDFLDVPGNTG